MDNNPVLFETKLSRWEKVVAVAEIMVGLVFMYILSIIRPFSWALAIVVTVCTLLIIIQAIRGAKTFILYADRIVIRRPLTFTDKTDVIVKTTNIRKLTFRRLSARHGGPHIMFDSKGFYESYRINFRKEILEEFIKCLKQLNIKVERDGL